MMGGGHNLPLTIDPLNFHCSLLIDTQIVMLLAARALWLFELGDVICFHMSVTIESFLISYEHNLIYPE